MKKTFSKVMLLGFGAILLLTSCLGDSDNSLTIDKTYAYIRLDESKTVKIAQVGGYPISNETLRSSSLQAGDCLVLGFKINDNISSDGQYYIAEYIQIPTEEDLIYRRENQISPWLNTVDTIKSDGEAYFNYLPTTPTTGGVSDLVMYNHELMGYRWFISYQYIKKKSEEAPKLRLYFDKNKQVNLDQSALANNEIVLDFRLEAQGSVSTDPQEETKTESKTDVINFTNMINYLNDEVSNGSKKTFNIKFRYFKKVDNPKSGEPAYKLTMTSNYVTSITIDKTETNS